MSEFKLPRYDVPIVPATDNIDRFIDSALFKISLGELRAKEHMTQRDLSKRSGLSLATISAIESCNISNPTLGSVIRYMDALGYDLALQKKK